MIFSEQLLGTASSDYPFATELFKRFVVIYGAPKVKSMYEHDDNAITPAMISWNAMLSSQRQDVLQRVMASLLSTPREWPPNLSQFIGLCNEYNRSEHREYVALPEPKQQTAVGRAALDNIRAMLKMPPKVEVEI